MTHSAEMLFRSARSLHERVVDMRWEVPAYQSLLEGYRDLGLPAGSAFLIYTPNTVEFLLHWIAILECGYVPCAVAPSTKISSIQGLQKSLNISCIVRSQLDSRFTNLKDHYSIGSFDVVVIDRALAAYQEHEILILTTGTSGHQTACVHTIDSLVCNASMTNAALNINADDTQLVVLPLYHTYGLVTQSIGSILSGGRLIIDGPPFNAGRFADLIGQYSVSVIGITPVIAREIIKRDVNLPPVRVISIGGNRVSPEEVSSLLSKPFVNELYITYGLTEAGPRVSYLPAHSTAEETYDSVGRAFDDVSIKIADPDAEGVGQLLVKTPSVCQRKVGNNIVRQPFSEDGYLETGDMFKIDRDGYLRHVARHSDIIFIKGEKLNARSIDAVAQAHPQVEYARTTEDDGDVLITRVWAMNNEVLDLEEIRSYMKSCLRMHEVPDRVIQVRDDQFHK